MEGELDPHLKPPEVLRGLFKKWRKANVAKLDLLQLKQILDTNTLQEDDRVHAIRLAEDRKALIQESLRNFMRDWNVSNCHHAGHMFELKDLPGLIIAPSILSAAVQSRLLNQLFHEQLSKKEHSTNLTMFYNVTYPHDGQSFFDLDPNMILEPKDPSVHKPITVKQMLEKHLRWVTLGGQYDWTKKQYPEEKPPQFPSRIAQLIQGMFPNIEPQAAILNLYTPGDTLSLHRDVSEECDQPLVSISIGCDALFMVANMDGSKNQVIRLRSGDAVLMSEQSRYAWHAVPKVLAGTCPDELRDWPSASHASHPHWKGWLGNKRINLNMRQMRLP